MSKNTHIVDVGDDFKGIECRCLARDCGWKFRSESRQERLYEAYKHVSEVINLKT